MLACVEEVPENYENMKKIYDALKLNEFSIAFHVTTDFRLINIVNGMQAAGSTYPCSYAKCKKPVKNTDWEIGMDRTFKNLHELNGKQKQIRIENS